MTGNISLMILLLRPYMKGRSLKVLQSFKQDLDQGFKVVRVDLLQIEPLAGLKV